MEKFCSSPCVSAVCDGQALSCALGKRSVSMSFSRSLGQTLIAAASTLAFCVAANWQFAPIVSSTAGTWKRSFKHIGLALTEPFYAFAYSVLSAFIMWYARRQLPGGKRGWGQEVAIMLNCPIFIEIPAAYSEIVAPIYDLKKSRPAHEAMQEAKGDNFAAYLDVSAETDIGMESIKAQIPRTDKSPDETMQEAKGDNFVAYVNVSAETDIAMESIKAQIPRPDESPGVSSVEWMKGLQIESESDIEDWHCAELPAKPCNYNKDDDDHLERVGSHQYSTNGHQHAKRYYIKLDPSPFNSREVHERFLLLQLKLVPEYEQLRFLRSRSTFQAVVTTVQALGYVFGVVQRMLTHKGRDISPLEAILSSFNLLVILQLLLNLYSCVHYQRPLLLRLHRRQFSNYSKAHDKSQERHRFLRYHFLDSNTSKLFLFIGAFISLLSLAIIQFAFIHYALFYLHHGHKCLLCSLSAFIFCLLAVSAVILIGILNSKKFRQLSAQAKLSFIIRIYSCIVNTASIVLALVATIISWDMFNKPNFNMFAWIIPHVSS